MRTQSIDTAIATVSHAIYEDGAVAMKIQFADIASAFSWHQLEPLHSSHADNYVVFEWSIKDSEGSRSQAGEYVGYLLSEAIYTYGAIRIKAI